MKIIIILFWMALTFVNIWLAVEWADKATWQYYLIMSGAAASFLNAAFCSHNLMMTYIKSFLSGES